MITDILLQLTVICLLENTIGPDIKKGFHIKTKVVPQNLSVEPPEFKNKPKPKLWVTGTYYFWGDGNFDNCLSFYKMAISKSNGRHLK